MSFDLNGAPASTAPRKGDSDKQSGTAGGKQDSLSLMLLGGAAEWPKRAALHITAKPFSYAPGKLETARATFNWYRGKDNGGDAIYRGPMQLEITSLTEVEKNQVGRLWKAAGTFSGDLKLMTGFQADIPVMKITNGTFADVLVQEVGK